MYMRCCGNSARKRRRKRKRKKKKKKKKRGGGSEVDLTLRQHLVKKGASPRAIAMADCGYANTAGCDLEQIGLRLVRKAEVGWLPDGEGDFRLQGSFSRVIKHLHERAEQHGVQFWTGTPVKSVRWGSDGIVSVEAESGRTFVGRSAVIAVPISVLRDGDIDFYPSLPRQKMLAIQSMRMGACAKILLKFSAPFWPSDMHGMICTDSFVPELWVNSTSGTGDLVVMQGDAGNLVGVDKPLPNGSEEFWVTGFCCGKSALAATSVPSSVAVERFLAQLATIFEGTEVCGKFIRGEVHDWSKDRFIRGGYSYPSSTELPRARQVLAEPLSSRLYFAGEATNTRCFMTLHGAIDSGCRAASEVLRDLRGRKALTFKLPEDETRW